MNKERMKPFIDALNSDEYTQIKDVYRNQNCFCAVGVAADVAMKNGCGIRWGKDGTIWEDMIVDSNGYADLKTLFEWYGIDEVDHNYIVMWNDQGGYTFNDIAKMLTERMTKNE